MREKQLESCFSQRHFAGAICAGASQIACMASEKLPSQFLGARRLRSRMEDVMKKKRLPALTGILLIILLAVVLLGKPFAEKSEGESSILSGESSGAAANSANFSANESPEDSAESSAEESQEPGGDESAGLTV